MKYFKKSCNQTIIRFNREWSAINWYYFETDKNNYVAKQIQLTYDGKVFKHDTNNLQAKNGGLAEAALEIEEYISIEKEDFFEIWNKDFSNTYLVKQLEFDEYWKFAWYNIDYNKTEQQLCDAVLIKILTCWILNL
jgi:hypothetical protein